MRFLRLGPRGHEVPCVLDADGRARDISSLVPDLTPAALGDPELCRTVAARLESLPAAREDERIGAPLTGIGKIICIGLNYSDHAEESGMTPPSEPILFQKAVSAVSGPYDPVVLPRESEKTDWEVELGVVIGSPARYVSEDAALDHVFGYCVGNDISERAFQLERGGQWTKGKSADTFAPLGPWLVTAEEVEDPQALSLKLAVNGDVRQDGTTANMIFGVRTLISYVSRFMSLLPGDLILTGTPAGVGAGLKPQVFLRPGDTMTASIEGLGEQRQDIVAHDAEGAGR